MSKRKPHSSAKKQAVNLTLSVKVLELAEKILEVKGQSSLSSLLEELIRNDYEKRISVLPVTNSPAKDAHSDSTLHNLGDAIASEVLSQEKPPEHGSHGQSSRGESQRGAKRRGRGGQKSKPDALST